MRALNYLGSKVRLAKWVKSFFPPHLLYVEPFGGGAGVLLNKPRSKVEVYNDLDGEVVNFFRVMRDPEQSAELIRRLRLTPYARAEHDCAWIKGSGDAVERARMLFVRSWCGVGSKGSAGSKAGFRRDGPVAAGEAGLFAYGVDGLAGVAERLRSVVIECTDALDLLAHYDSTETLFYVDPPYSAKGIQLYRNGIDHESLLESCLSLEGFCIVSGYQSDLYADRLASWHVERLDTKVACFRHKPVTECLWISPRTWKALQKERRRAPMPLLRLCQPLCG